MTTFLILLAWTLGSFSLFYTMIIGFWEPNEKTPRSKMLMLGVFLLPVLLFLTIHELIHPEDGVKHLWVDYYEEFFK